MRTFHQLLKILMVYAITAYINNTNMFISIHYHLALSATSGSYKSAGLPDLDGSFATNASTTSYSGVFFGIAGGENNYTSALGTTAMNKIGMRLSRQNAIYGNSATVQPNSYTVKKIIKY